MRRCRPGLGTYVEVDVDAAEGDARALAAIDAAFAVVARVEAAMSFHREDSDLACLNRAAPGTELDLDPWTVEVLRLAAALQQESDGLFDCAVGAELVAAGLLPGRPDARPSGCLLTGLVFLGDARVRVDAPLCLDLGGIAKGFAVDRAVQALELGGVRHALVNAGGDLRVLGRRPRLIHLRSIGAPGVLHAAGSLADGALATSSSGFTRGALIDPQSRRAVDRPLSFSVLADRCAVADALTKVVAVTGRIDHPVLQRRGAVAFIR